MILRHLIVSCNSSLTWTDHATYLKTSRCHPTKEFRQLSCITYIYIYIHIYIYIYICQLQIIAIYYSKIQHQIKFIHIWHPRCPDGVRRYIGTALEIAAISSFGSVWQYEQMRQKKNANAIHTSTENLVCLFVSLHSEICLYSSVFWSLVVQNRFRNDAPVLLNFWNSEPKSPEWLVVARGNAKPNPNWHKCLHEHAWTKCKASAPNHVWDLGATETWGTRKSRDPCFVQFSKFGKNSVKVPPILCEAETTSPSTAVPHGLMVEFIARPAPPQTRNVWFDVCISENIEN